MSSRENKLMSSRFHHVPYKKKVKAARRRGLVLAERVPKRAPNHRFLRTFHGYRAICGFFRREPALSVLDIAQHIFPNNSATTSLLPRVSFLQQLKPL